MKFPDTINGLGPFECISAIQKYIRRGMEVEAFEVACEMGETSKAFATWVTNRLQVISHEDIGLVNPQLIVFVATCCRQAKEMYKPDKTGPWKMIVGNMIRMMARSPKSREGDHFMGVAIRHQLDGVSEIEEWTYDHHSRAGRKLGRDLEYFRKESTKLVPKQKGGKDQYEDLFYEQIARKNAAKTARAKGGQAEMFE